MNADEQGDGFLRRWSARKSQTRQDIAADTESDPPLHADPILADLADPALDPRSGEIDTQVPADAPADSEHADDAEPLLTDADMPPLTSLTEQSDMRQFFNRGVSKALRQAALAHVFRLPAYNVRDGLNEYDDDYTQFEPLGDTVTADMRFHAARKERERLARLEEEAGVEGEADVVATDPADSEIAATDPADASETESAPDELEPVAEPDTPSPLEPSPPEADPAAPADPQAAVHAQASANPRPTS